MGYWLLFIFALVLLKLANLITISWLMVALIPVIVFLILFAIVFIIAFLVTILKEI